MGQQISNFAFLDPGASLTLVSSVQRAHAVEFPVLARFAVLAGNRPWRPFVTFGPTIRRTSIGAISSATILSGTDLSPVLAQPGSNAQRVEWNVDPAVGAGVDLKTGRLHLEPQVRYSYWGAGVNSPSGRTKSASWSVFDIGSGRHAPRADHIQYVFCLVGSSRILPRSKKPAPPLNEMRRAEDPVHQLFVDRRTGLFHGQKVRLDGGQVFARFGQIVAQQLIIHIRLYGGSPVTRRTR